jgi:hypothetical protein
MNAPPPASMRPNLTLSPSGLRSHELTPQAMPCGICFRKGWDAVPPAIIVANPHLRKFSDRLITPPSWAIRPEPPWQETPVGGLLIDHPDTPASRHSVAPPQLSNLTPQQRTSRVDQIHSGHIPRHPQRQPPPVPTCHQTTLTLPAQPLPESTAVDTRRTRTWMSSRARADPSGSKPGPQFGCAYAWQTMHPWSLPALPRHAWTEKKT